jgi:hypothetical protein
MRSAKLLFWAILPALFIFIAELIIGVRWWAYVVPPVVALIGLLLLHDVWLSDTNRPFSRDDTFKIISMSGAAIVAIALTGTFFESVRRDQEKIYQQALLEECTKISTVLYEFAVPRPWEVKQETYQMFWQLFFGPLIIVEGKEVSDAMVEVATLINAHAATDQGQPKCWESDDVTKLHALTLNVVEECRNQIRTVGIAAADFVPGQLQTENVNTVAYLDRKLNIGAANTVSGQCPAPPQ